MIYALDQSIGLPICPTGRIDSWDLFLRWIDFYTTIIIHSKVWEFIISYFCNFVTINTNDSLIICSISFIFWYQYLINIPTYTSFVHLGFSARIKRREIIYSSSHLILPQKSFLGTNDVTIKGWDASTTFLPLQTPPSNSSCFYTNWSFIAGIFSTFLGNDILKITWLV